MLFSVQSKEIISETIPAPYSIHSATPKSTIEQYVIYHIVNGEEPIALTM